MLVAAAGHVHGAVQSRRRAGPPRLTSERNVEYRLLSVELSDY